MSKTEAKRIACNAIEQSFNAQTATVMQKQRYSECIDFLYTVPLPSNEILVFKLIVCAIMLVWLMTGLYLYFKEHEDIVLSVIGSLLMTMAASCVFGVLFASITFLFS